MPKPVRITEATTSLREATVEPTGKRVSVELINPGWGSSGYYSPAVLAEAARTKVFAAGTKMFADHPSAVEEMDRPERSVRDIWGILETDATVGANGGLFAEARIVPDAQPVIAALRDDIGISIRAAGICSAGEAEGRRGTIIDAITAAESVDFVTAAGRGGRVAALLESARRPVSLVEMSPGVTADDMRSLLRAAIEDAYPNGAHGTCDPESHYGPWVEDFTDEWVVFNDCGDLYQQSYTATADAVTLAGTPSEVVRHTTYVPAPDAGLPETVTATEAASTTEESEETPMPQLTEAEGRALEDARTAAETALAEARRELAAVKAREAARPVVAAALAESTVLDDVHRELLAESVLAALPTDANGALDAAALTTKVTEARSAAEAKVTAAEAAAGAGRPRSLGDSNSSATEGEITEADLDKTLARAFGRPIQGV